MNNNTEINNVALNALDLPEDLKKLDINQCKELCREIRQILIDTVSCFQPGSSRVDHGNSQGV